MTALKDRLITNSTIKETAILSQSLVYNKKELIDTGVPMINVAFSGDIDGGFSAGLTVWAGPSKHFKTGFSLLCARAFLKKHQKGTLLFYDSEFGTPDSYFESFGIDSDNVVHSPIVDVEQLRFDLTRQLDRMEEKDELMIIIDSVGNLASRKEVEDALDGKSVADMTRAKQLKSLWRIITPRLVLKGVPLIAVNHTYKELALFPKEIVSGGRGGEYSSTNVFILGRQQDKASSEKDIRGYHFIINVEKSRYSKEKSKIPVSISWEGGINKWSGMLEQALEHGSVVKPQNGWYSVCINGVVEDKKYREKDIIANDSVWNEIFSKTDLASFINAKYSIPHGLIMHEDQDSVEQVEDTNAD